MEEKEAKSNNFMKKLASFIVDKRKAFVILFGIACIYCAVSVSKVRVNNDLTTYLPEDTETRQGLTIMEDEFVTFGSAKIMVANVTYERARTLAEHIETMKGISEVKFYDPGDDAGSERDRESNYRDSSALFTVTFEEEEDTDGARGAMEEIREYLSPYDTYIYSAVGKDDSAELQKDMGVILVIVLFIIVAVLLFTSRTYMEIVIFLLVFAVAAVLNMGTNYLFEEISFVTNAVGTVLQLALAIDYAIILCHRFMEEKETMDTREAMITALSKAIPEISSSSLTTVSGMIALMLMQFGIGMDMGRVLTKAIVISLLTVFLLMPALIVMFAKGIEKTAHKSFVPKITIWGKFVVKSRFAVLPLFLAAVAASCFLANKCAYIYDVNSVQSDKKTDFILAKEKIEHTFGVSNVMAVIVPKGDYKKEAKILEMLEEMEAVDYAIGLSNVEVDEQGDVLTDEVTPRKFSEIGDVDIDMIRLAYSAYAVDKGEYGALMGNIDDFKIPIIKMVTFLYEQNEKGALNLEEDVARDIENLYGQIRDAQLQMEGENYSRLVFAMKGPVEGEETFALIDRIRSGAEKYYDEVYVVGDATSDYDLSTSFLTDNVKISVLTALFVGLILLFTFQSAGLPFMLVLTIQSSIWINFSFPYLTSSPMFFLSYLIVSAIQMGATIDYAIVITSRYMVLREEMEKKAAVIETLNQSFPTIVTSGSILTCAGFVIGKTTSNATIASLGSTLGRGSLISIILVMLVLPQILLAGDRLIDKTAFTVSKKGEDEARQVKNGRVIVAGFLSGSIAGKVNAQVYGTIDGDFEGSIRSRSSVMAEYEERKEALLEETVVEAKEEIIDEEV